MCATPAATRLSSRTSRASASRAFGPPSTTRTPTFLDNVQGKLLPHSQTIVTFSPLVGFVLKDRAKLVLEYDFVRDHLGLDESGKPTDAENDAFTARLQVEL